MKRKLIISSIVLGIIILGIVGLWAYKTGKFAGLADIIGSTTTPPSVGVLINVKDGSTPVAGALVHVCPHTITDPSVPNCAIGSALNGITNSNGQYDLFATSPICTNDPRPYSYLSFYVSKTGYNTTSYKSVSIDDYCSKRNNLDFNLTQGNVVVPPPPPTPPDTAKVDLIIVVGDKSNYQQALPGIPVVIDGTARATTDTYGYVILRGIDAGNHKLEINPYGDASCNSKYTQIVVPSFLVKNQIINPAGDIGKQVAGYDLDLRAQNETFTLQGKITGPDGSLLEGAKIEVVCALCGMGPWQTTSTSERQGYYGNYQIKNIYNTNRTGINDTIYVRITKDGYLYDPNNDGQMDSIVIEKTDIVWKFDHFEANKDFQLSISNIKTTFSFIAEIVNAANTDLLVGGVKVEISPNPIINNVYGWEETSTDNPVDETKYDKVNLVAEDLLQPTPDCSSKNTTYTVTYTHSDYQTYTPQTFNCGEIKFDQKLQTYLYNAGRVELRKIPLLSIKGTVSSYSDEKLEGARVSLKKETNNIRIAETNTGEEGRYNFDNLNIEKTATYLIKAEYYDYAPQEFKMSGQEIIDDAKYHININFVLLREDRGGIKGYVVKEGDSGIRYATISVLSGDKLVVTASSDEQGNYIIPDIEPGDYTVSVYAMNYFNPEDLSGLVKKATVKEKKFTEVNFELTYKRYDATTVYLELLDHTGSPIDYENLKEPSGAEFHKVYRIYENDKELHGKDGKQYLKFSDIPCGENLELEVFFDYKYSAQILRYYKKTKMHFNCSGSGSDNEEYVSLKMEVDPRMPQDENKGYLEGEFILEKCDYNRFYTKWAKIILKDSQDRKYKEAIIEDERYFSIQNIDPGRYTVYLEGNNIVSDPQTINIKKGRNDLVLSVRPKDSATFTKSISKNGFEVYFVGPISQDYIDSINWDDYTRALNNLKNNLVKPGLVKDFPTKIVVTDTDNWGRWVGPGTCALGISGSYIQISYNELPDLVRSKDLLVMKMANYVWFNLSETQEWNDFKEKLNSMGSVGDCVISALNPNSICGKYRVSVGGNLFQNVFLDYFVYHTQFDALNRNMKLSGNEQCFHLLSFFWEFFAKYVQKSASETAASANTGSSSLFVYSNAADFYEPVGGKLGVYSKNQLLGGLWKQSVYDKLNPVQKARVQATIVYSRVINFLKIDPGKYSNQVAVSVVKFNQWIDQILGSRGDRGSIEGVVQEQNGGPKIPKENVIVIIGKKMAVTDKDGKFRIENIKTGEQKVKIIDGETSRNLNVDLETVNIQKDKTIKRYFTVN